MRRWFILFIILVNLLYISCNNSIDIEVYSDFKLRHLDFEAYEKAVESGIKEINLYIIQPMVMIPAEYYTAERSPNEMKCQERITDEKLFREICDYKICLKDTPMIYVSFLLYTAKPITNKNLVKKREYHVKNMREIQGGMIIDVIKETGDIQTFIMENDSRYIFYDKENPNIFYRMPKIFLKKFIINFSETSHCYKYNN